MRRSLCWLAPLSVLLWCLAPLTAAAKYTDPDGWGRAAECVNWNEDDLIVGGMQPVDDFQEIIPERLYPAIVQKLDPAWRKCCVPSFNLLNACYKAGTPLPYPPFDPPNGPDVHVIVRLSCNMACGLTGRLRNLPLSPVTVDAQAHVPVDAADGPVEFTEFKTLTAANTRPANARPANARPANARPANVRPANVRPG